jgi:hypothetical protein
LLPAGATAAAITCVEEEGLVEADSERAPALVQHFCGAQAAFESFEDDRLALLQGAIAEADRALARLQREHARAQDLVSMKPSHGVPSLTPLYMLVYAWRPRKLCGTHV